MLQGSDWINDERDRDRDGIDDALVPPAGSAKRAVYRVVFEHTTSAGRAFDVALLVLILLSIAAVVLESMAGVRARWGRVLFAAEMAFTVLFTIEYVVRLCCVQRPLRYASSFFGLVDLVALLPTYLALIVPGTQSLLVIRALRLLRMFRVLKMGQYLSEAGLLRGALIRSRRKITVFVLFVVTTVIIVGSAMHLIEGPENGFDDIPTGVYWAVVTLTTVGYGDVAPKTGLGRLVAATVMILGYGVIAVPTGIVTSELVGNAQPAPAGRRCRRCDRRGHDADANYCNICGERLQDDRAL
jgi:voltage-gated potassium channel